MFAFQAAFRGAREVTRRLDTELVHVLKANCGVSGGLNVGSPDNAGNEERSCSAGEIRRRAVEGRRVAEKGQENVRDFAVDLASHQGKPVSTDMLYHALKECIAKKDLVLGRAVHDLAVSSGYESNAFVGNHIIRMYASSGKLVEAYEVFHNLSSPDVFVWASIISAHAELGQAEQAIKLYRQMRHSAVKPNEYVFVAVLKACASVGDLTAGRLVHSDVSHRGCESNVFVGSSLVNMYAKCGRLPDAQKVFDLLVVRDVVTWNAMIAAYTSHGHSCEALKLYGRMQQDGKLCPDDVTYVGLLKACGSLGAIQEGKQIHGEILKRRMELDISVGSSLVDMYAKCGSLPDARRVFDRMPVRNVVTWSAMIAGYAEHGFGEEAINLYTRLEQEGLLSAANHVTFLGVLKACSSMGAVDKGKKVHSHVIERGIEAHKLLGTALVDFYAKCGRLGDAQRVFDRLSTRDVVTWNALINGYGQQNNCRKAIEFFEEMLVQGIEPDAATFLALLVACSHVGWQSEGRQYMKSMVEEHGITPGIEHYTCMVDLLSRSGCLDEAQALLHAMPFDPDHAGWMALLTACKAQGNVELGRNCFERLVLMDPKQAAGYVLMANIYADAGMWESVHEMESMRKRAGAQKKPALALIEVGSMVHKFVIGDERSDTTAKLRSLNAVLVDGDKSIQAHPGSGEPAEAALCGHAEKLAIAFGLLNTPKGQTLLVTKNLRMCSDCHTGSKAISQMEGREIIVRDAHSVHRFRNGSCSCEEDAR